MTGTEPRALGGVTPLVSGLFLLSWATLTVVLASSRLMLDRAAQPLGFAYELDVMFDDFLQIAWLWSVYIFSSVSVVLAPLECLLLWNRGVRGRYVLVVVAGLLHLVQLLVALRMSRLPWQ